MDTMRAMLAGVLLLKKPDRLEACGADWKFYGN
jgi:hypothetical protein